MLAKYISVGLEALTTRATWRLQDIEEKPDWEVVKLGEWRQWAFKFEALRPDILLYTGDNPYSLAIIADWGAKREIGMKFMDYLYYEDPVDLTMLGYGFIPWPPKKEQPSA